MKIRRTGAFAVAVALALAFAVKNCAGDPIYTASQDRPSTVERRVCSQWLPVSRSQVDAWEMEWWVLVTAGSELHNELRSARRLQFEIDPGSGLSDVCVARQIADHAEATGVVRALSE